MWRPIPADAVAKLRATLESAGVQFIPESGGGPGVRLRKQDDGRNVGPVGAQTRSCIQDNN